MLIIGKSKGSSHDNLNSLPSKILGKSLQEKGVAVLCSKGEFAHLPLQGTFKWYYFSFSSTAVIYSFLCCIKILINFFSMLGAILVFFFFPQINYHES